MSALSRDRHALKFATREEYAINFMRRTPAGEEFCTDSMLLDSSKIPTPSPSKSKSGTPFESRPRRAIGNTRTLKAAWEATATSARSPSPESTESPTRRNHKPLPKQATNNQSQNHRHVKHESSILPPWSSPAVHEGLQHDSPSLSNSHEFPSSPPPALEDTYRRIAEEQELNDNEHEWIKEETTASSGSGDNSSDHRRARSRAGTASKTNSPSPSRFRRIKRQQSPSVVSDHNKENEQEWTGITNATDLSFLNNLTDQNLAAKLTPHALDKVRDRGRLERAIQQPSVLAFRRAQVGFKYSLSAENLAQAGAEERLRPLPNSSDGSGHSVRSVQTEDHTTPPPNVPKTWGSKGRVDRDWLRRIKEKTPSPSSQRSNFRYKQSRPETEQSPDPTEIPLPGTDSSSTLLSERFRNATPASWHGGSRQLSSRNSQDRLREWDFNDITGSNLAVSMSPPVKVRKRTQERPRDHEIEAVEKRAVTTNRLDEIVKKNTAEMFDVQPRRLSEGAAALAGNHTPSGKSDFKMSAKYEGEAIPQTPIVVFKGTASVSQQQRTAENTENADSKNLTADLQRLARAISESPHSSLASEAPTMSDVGGEVSMTEGGDDALGTDQTPRIASVPSPVAMQDSSGVVRSRSADAIRTPMVAGAWNDTILPETANTIKQERVFSKYAQTPRVTGGWIDTPKPSGLSHDKAVASPHRSSSAEADFCKSNDRIVANGAGSNGTLGVSSMAAKPLPRSALTSLLTKARRKLVASTGRQRQEDVILEGDEDMDGHGDENCDRATGRAMSAGDNETLNLGDATIDSLEGLLTLNKDEISTLLQLGEEYSAAQREAGHEDDTGNSQPDFYPAPVHDTELIGRLAPRLQNICSNIHDVRKGISALEQQLSQPGSEPTKMALPSMSSNRRGKHPQQQHQQTSSLLQPSSLSSSSSSSSSSSNPNPPGTFLSTFSPTSYLQLSLPKPTLFHPPRKDLNQRLPRPTILGYLLLLFWTWYLSESILCARYCHPEYAESYVWPEARSSNILSAPASASAWSVLPSSTFRTRSGGHFEADSGLGLNADFDFGLVFGPGRGWGYMTIWYLYVQLVTLIGSLSNSLSWWPVKMFWLPVRILVRWCAVSFGWSDGFVGEDESEDMMGLDPASNSARGARDGHEESLAVGMEGDEFL